MQSESPASPPSRTTEPDNGATASHAPVRRQWTRVDAIVRRWLDLFAYAVISSSMMLLAGDLPAASTDTITRPFGSLPANVSCGALAVLVGAAAWMLRADRWLGLRGLRHAIAYPPLGVAMLLGLVIVLFVRGAVQGWEQAVRPLEGSLWAMAAVPLWLWGLLAVPLLYGLGAHRIGQGLASPRTATSSNEPWFAQDHPIEDPTDARERLNEIALRMAKRLAASDGHRTSMAVEGELGAGKTTVGILVAHHLRATPKVLFTTVSLWPYDSAEGAVAGILNEVQRTLGERVDTTALTGISSEYVAVAEGLGGIWAAALQLLRPGHDPAEVIGYVDQILLCAGLRLVLWIDDLERFAEPASDSGTNGSKIDRVLARPVLALLHLLDQADRISVILSGTTQAVRVDPGKIARYVERIPCLDADEVRSEIETLRERCFAMKVVDPIPPAIRANSFRGEHDPDSPLADLLATDAIPNLAMACAVLIRTPRNLKCVLRLTDECWRAIAGEVDFDSILVATVIRVTRPDLFALLSEHVRRFRTGHISLGAEPKPSSKHATFVLLDRALESEPEWPDRAALKRLVSSVLPESMREKAWGKDYLNSPQSLGVNRHADYWSRYISQSIPTDEPRDQELLREIEAWRQGGTTARLVQRLLEARTSQQMESFVGIFSGDEICQLLEALSEFASSARPDQLPHAACENGLIAVWRMAHERRPAEGRVEQAVRSVIPKLVRSNLPLAFSVHYYFAFPDGSVPPLVAPDVSKALWELLNQSLLDELLSAESLIRALRVENPYSLFQTIWGLSRARAGKLDGLPQPRWPEIARVLLDAAELDPALVLPHIVPFVTQTGTRDDVQADDSGVSRLHREYTATFIESRAKDLFDLDWLYRLFAANECPPYLDPAMRECYRVVREAATAALAAGTRRNDATTGEDSDGFAER